MRSLFRDPDHALVLDRLSALRPDTTRRWGRMNAHQAVCHLSDAFRMVLGERASDYRADTLFNRTLGRVFALSTPIPWPKGIPTSPDADQEKGGTPPGDFATDVADLRGLMDRFRAAGGRNLDPHVALGRLTPAEWGRWGYRHVDHHLRQFGL